VHGDAHEERRGDAAAVAAPERGAERGGAGMAAAEDGAAPMEEDQELRPRASPLFNYVVTAQPPTAVTHAVVGHFTGPGDVNLILGCAPARPAGRGLLRAPPLPLAAAPAAPRRGPSSP
jgi:hypothetical protein